MAPARIFFNAVLRVFGYLKNHQGSKYWLENPPEGYEYVSECLTSRRPFSTISSSMLELGGAALRNGASAEDVIRFLESRDLDSQLLIPDDCELCFLTTFPYTVGHLPWVIEIEEALGLFAPLGQSDPRLTGWVWDDNHVFLPCVKALLESENCKAIICHVEATGRSLPAIFKSSLIKSKVAYVPLGIPKLFPAARRNRQSKPVCLLFTSSFHQDPVSFYLRGGLDTLHAFNALSRRCPDALLIMRCRVPASVQRDFGDLLSSGRVVIHDEMLSTHEMRQLLASSDIFVLPAAGLHAFSLLEAMSAGLAVVSSDGWGIQDYIQDGWNGRIIAGRGDMITGSDSEGVKLWEDFRPMFYANHDFIERLSATLYELIEDAPLRSELGRHALEDTRCRFSIERSNALLKGVFDRAVGKSG